MTDLSNYWAWWPFPWPSSLLGWGLPSTEFEKVGTSVWHISLAITTIKLLLQPLVVWMLARVLDLPAMETQVVVLLASIGVGANVYLMSRQFKVLEGPVAGSLVLSTLLAALTTPLVLALTH